MLLAPLILKVPGRNCLLEFGAEVVGKAIQQGAVPLGIGIQLLQSSCNRKGTREPSDLTFFPSHLLISSWCFPLDKPNQKPEGKGLCQLIESKKVSLTRHRAGWRRAESKSKEKTERFQRCVYWLALGAKNHLYSSRHYVNPLVSHSQPLGCEKGVVEPELLVLQLLIFPSTITRMGEANTVPPPEVEYEPLCAPFPTVFPQK